MAAIETNISPGQLYTNKFLEHQSFCIKTGAPRTALAISLSY